MAASSRSEATSTRLEYSVVTSFDRYREDNTFMLSCGHQSTLYDWTQVRDVASLGKRKPQSTLLCDFAGKLLH